MCDIISITCHIGSMRAHDCFCVFTDCLLYFFTGNCSIFLTENDCDTDALLLKLIKRTQNTVVLHLSGDHMVARMQ